MSSQIKLAPVVFSGQEHEDRGYCYSAHYDGPTVHTIYCRRDPRDGAVSGSDCISSGQDGSAIKAARDQAADQHRFTPPEYRTPPDLSRHLSNATIGFVKGQVTEKVALRGRPNLADGSGEWTTWETFTETDPDFEGVWFDAYRHQIPKRMSAPDAAELVALFRTRVPTHEFKVVRARLVTEEELIG